MQFGNITEDISQIFSITQNSARPYEYYNQVHLSISYEFNLDLYGVNRDVYNILNWLGDVGGLRDALFLIGAFILCIYGKIRGDFLDEFLL